MARSVAIIGAGQIGFAAECEFAFHGWEVSVHARSKPRWEMWEHTRYAPYVTGVDEAPRADIVLDTIAYDEDDVARYDAKGIGRLIVVSSASVYRDAEGRTLDEATENGFPRFDGPITEDQPTVEPGIETYSTRKVRMENMARTRFGERATILRPCAIIGEHSRHPREWWFVKRMLDGRTLIPLAFEGRSRFQTTTARDIGNFAEEVATSGWGGTFNIGTEDAPSVLEIGHRIAAQLGSNVEFVPFEGPPVGNVGRTPWSVSKPFVVSSLRSRQAGDGFGEITGIGMEYGGFDVEAPIRWLADLNPADWRTAFPHLAAYPWDLFDYEAEDRFLASL